jgi:hypothetical protein
METILSRTPIATRSSAEIYRDQDWATANAQYSGSNTIKIPGNAIRCSDIHSESQAFHFE